MQKQRSMNHKEKEINQQDYVTNKLLIGVTLALVCVAGLMVLHKNLSNGQNFFAAYSFVKILTGVGLLGMLFGGIWWGVQCKRKQDTTGHYWIGKHVFVLSAVLAGSMGLVLALTYFFFAYTTAIQFLYAALPALAILYVCFHSYPHEFFVISSACTVAAAFIWLMRQLLDKANWNYGIAFVAAAVALALIGAVVVLVAKKNQGKMGKLDLFGEAAGYAKMLLNLVVMAALVIASVAFGPLVAYYLLFVVFGLLFVWIVYYTVKMM